MRRGKGPAKKGDDDRRGRADGRRRAHDEGDPRGRRDDAPPRRRALSAVEGDVTTRGDATLAAVLGRALSAPRRDDFLPHVHGFHPWPARMHPDVAGVVLDGLAGEGRVLDPFMGSGTVVIEAMLRGRAAVGVDLNPLGALLTRVKTTRVSAPQGAALIERAEEVGEASIARVKARTEAQAALPRHFVERYAPYVLKELAGLKAEIDLVEDPFQRDALSLVFSSLVVKYSRRRADTSTELQEKRVGRFHPSRFFVEKAQELGERLMAFARELPRGARPPTLVTGDARAAPKLVEGPFALVLTSPPYGGTYDYARHHEERLAWLGLDARAFERLELGARRRLSEGARGAATWDDEVRAMLVAMRKVLAPDGHVVLLVGDGEVGGTRVDAAEQLARLAPDAALTVVAAASATRPDWRGGRARREHLVALAHATPPTARAPASDAAPRSPSPDARAASRGARGARRR